MKPTYLLIAYDTEKGNDVQHAMHKIIDKNDYNLLREDFTRNIELNTDSYEITTKHFACISFAATTTTYLIIIQIKLCLQCQHTHLKKDLCR